MGCGDENATPEDDLQVRADMFEQCDYLQTTIKNNDELLACEVVLDSCTTAELVGLVTKWTCDIGEDPASFGQECRVDDDTGEQAVFEVAISPECQEGIDTIVPQENGWWDNALWMISNGKLPDSYWCGPGDDASENKGIVNGVDGACRRHDHGNGYNEGGPNEYWYLAWVDLPKAQCGVDAGIVHGANNQSGNSFTRDMINFVFGSTSFYHCRAQVYQATYSSYSCNCGWWGCSTCYRHTGYAYVGRDVSGSSKAAYADRNTSLISYKDNCRGDEHLNDPNACE